MPKIALKVKSAIELLIINYYYWSCYTTKMQIENKGNMKRHWKNEAELKWGSSAEHGGAGKPESGAQAGWDPPEHARTKWTNTEILLFIFKDGI